MTQSDTLYILNCPNVILFDQSFTHDIPMRYFAQCLLLLPTYFLHSDDVISCFFSSPKNKRKYIPGADKWKGEKIKLSCKFETTSLVFYINVFLIRILSISISRTLLKNSFVVVLYHKINHFPIILLLSLVRRSIVN